MRVLTALCLAVAQFSVAHAEVPDLSSVALRPYAERPITREGPATYKPGLFAKVHGVEIIPHFTSMRGNAGTIFPVAPGRELRTDEIRLSFRVPERPRVSAGVIYSSQRFSDTDELSRDRFGRSLEKGVFLNVTCVTPIKECFKRR